MPRLFAAIEIPEDIRDALSDMEVPMPGARWVEADNMHLTLRFAGDIEKGVAREFAHALARIELPAFTMRVSGIGSFGGNDPRTIWAAIEAFRPATIELMPVTVMMPITTPRMVSEARSL